MKTITPVELQMLIDNGDVELIDVRPEKDFKRFHSLGARSIPLSRFEPHAVLAHRRLDRHAPLYIMSDKKASASLAACGLASAGLADPIVVEGGIDAWEGQCLPSKRKQAFRLPPLNLSHAMGLFGLAFAVSLFFDGFPLVAGVFALAVVAAVLEYNAVPRREREAKSPARWRARFAGSPLLERPPI